MYYKDSRVVIQSSHVEVEVAKGTYGQVAIVQSDEYVDAVGKAASVV